MAEQQFRKISISDFERINIDNVLIFSFAETGAMGSRGEINIILRTKIGIRSYQTNYVYNETAEKRAEFDEWKEQEQKVFNVLPMLKDIDLNENRIRYFFKVDKEWLHFCMGMGNHLFIRTKLEDKWFKQFRKHDLGLKGELYNSWQEYALKVLDENI